MAAEADARPRSSSRRRSQPNFQDLRLAPLSAVPPVQQSNASAPLKSPGDPLTESAYRQNHASYLSSGSAPVSPGILSRSSSRKNLHGGLSQKAVDFDLADGNRSSDQGYFDYSSVSVAPHGGARDRIAGEIDSARRKARSESGLPDLAATRAQQNLRAKTGPATTNPKQTDPRSKRRSYHSKTVTAITRGDENWLTHATTYTTSLLAEGKGSAWASPLSSSTNLHRYSRTKIDSSDSEDDQHASRSSTRDPRIPDQRIPLTILPFPSANLDPTLLPLRSPSLTQTWGSRFGSRPTSAAPSRRNSRSHLDRPTRPLSGLMSPRMGSMPNAMDPSPRNSVIQSRSAVPDFVDPAARAEIAASLATVAAQRNTETAGSYFSPGASPAIRAGMGGEAEDTEDDESHVARLARTPGFGFTGGFGLIDRLVGLSGAAFDEEREEHGRQYGDEAESEGRRVQGMRTAPVPKVRAADEGSAEQMQPQQHEGHGWSDAAWLLSVASKVLL